MSSTPAHPGTILFVDENSGKEHSRPISEVPEQLRFAQDASGQMIPVVKVVAHAVGQQRTIREYGPNGEMLRSTIQIKQLHDP